MSEKCAARKLRCASPHDEDDLKNENDFKNEDNLKNEDNIKNEGDLKNEHNLKNWPSPPKFFCPPPLPFNNYLKFFSDDFSCDSYTTTDVEPDMIPGY